MLPQQVRECRSLFMPRGRGWACLSCHAGQAQRGLLIDLSLLLLCVTYLRFADKFWCVRCWQLGPLRDGRKLRPAISSRQQKQLLIDGLLSSNEITRNRDSMLVSGHALKLREYHIEAGGYLCRKSRKSCFELLRLPRDVASARRCLHARLNSSRELKNQVWGNGIKKPDRSARSCIQRATGSLDECIPWQL